MSEEWTTLKVLDWTVGRFERAGLQSARLDAQILLAHALKCPRMALYTSFDKPLAPAELATYRGLIQRRLDGEPVAYLTGTQEFWSLTFAVDARVLIPRPDTETLVQVALELGDAILTEDGAEALRVVEVATGSGAVTVALAHERKQWSFVATDLSADALSVAKKNADTNGVADRVEFREGHLHEPLAGDLPVSLLVSNLPYISEADMKGLAADVLHEPHGALCGGPAGTELITELLAGLGDALAPGGWVALEHGFDQGEAVQAIASEAGFSEVQTRSDLAGRARVTFFRKAKNAA